MEYMPQRQESMQVALTYAYFLY